MSVGLRKVGYCLEYVQNLNLEYEAAGGAYFGWTVERLCSFESKELNLRDVDARPHGREWRSLLCVYHNLIERGLPTYPTLEIERMLTDIVSRIITIKESDHKDKVVFRDDLDSEFKTTWVSALAQAHVATDPYCNALHGKMESKEEELFLDLVAKEVGSCAHQLFESQRPFSTLVSGTEAALFHHQRVDFCLETPTTKLIFEIEGAQHKEKSQQTLDKRRIDVLKNAGWTVVSVPAADVRQGNVAPIMQLIKSIFTSDKYLAATSRGLADLVGTEAGRAALQLVITPIAIARVQWALIWAALNGQLDLEKQALRVAIVEKDVPCGLLAVRDFLRTLHNLLILAGIKQSLPVIQLDIVRSEHFQQMDDNAIVGEESFIKVSKHDASNLSAVLNKPLDLAIQISTLHGGSMESVPTSNRNPTIIINSVHSPRGVRRIESAHPITYKPEGEQSNQSLHFFLNWIFRKREFWDGQLKILTRSLALKDVIGLLQTGGGKSLCYQLSALLQPGLTLIVEPLRSIMLDQTENLRQTQIDFIAHVSSDQDTKLRELTIERMAQGDYLMIFISPERFQIRNFRSRLQEVCLHTSVPYLVIDEVHCVSEWGHDFRPSYLGLAYKARTFCLHRGYKSSIIALTGTASWVVLSDVQREIDVVEEEAIISPDSFNRPELEFEVVKCESIDKPSALRGKLRELPQHFGMTADRFFQSKNAGIIFCPHVNGQYGVESVASIIALNLPEVPSVAIYSGDMPRSKRDSREWEKEKILNQEAFKQNRIPLMVATKAFGMGIDKQNIRYTIHYNIPTSLEAFYQESGRAGRDKELAHCTMIFSGDPSRWEALNDPDYSAQELAELIKKTPRSSQDDIYRMLYFHSNSWRGEEQEFNSIMHLLDSTILSVIGKLDSGRSVDLVIPFDKKPAAPFEGGLEASNEENRTLTEKTLYRLSILGIVLDYTLDHRGRQFEVKVQKCSDTQIITALLDFIGRYKPAENRDNYAKSVDSTQGVTVLEKCLRILLEFVYQEIEKKRRRAILQIADVASTCTDDVSFRDALLDYLEKSKFTQSLIEISARIVPGEWAELASKVEDIDSSRQLLGGCRRALESYPDHPGLVLLGAFARIMIPGMSDQTTLGEFQRAMKLISRTTNSDLPHGLARMLSEIGKRRPSLVNQISMMVLHQFRDREIARTTLMYVDQSSQSGVLALQILLTGLCPQIRQVTKHHSRGERIDK